MPQERSWNRRDILWRLSLVAGAASQVAAGAQDEDAVFKTGIRVVNLLATVRSKSGDVVRDLTREDFNLLENGRPQQIRYFSAETGLPLTLGLLVDTSMSQARILDAERTASFRFLDQILREDKDHVFVMQFDMAVLLRQRLTASRRQLEESLALVDTPSRKELQMQSGGGTLLYDAVVKACLDVTSKLTNRKALIILSDGVDTGSLAGIGDAIDAAVRTDTIIYSILFEDTGYYPGSHPDGRKALSRLAQESGGGYFEVSKRRSIEQIFAVLETELRSQYSLGFVSDTPTRYSEFRQLRLSARRKDLVVQARDRYWAQR